MPLIPKMNPSPGAVAKLAGVDRLTGVNRALTNPGAVNRSPAATAALQAKAARPLTPAIPDAGAIARPTPMIRDAGIARPPEAVRPAVDPARAAAVADAGRLAQAKAAQDRGVARASPVADTGGRMMAADMAQRQAMLARPRGLGDVFRG